MSCQIIHNAPSPLYQQDEKKTSLPLACQPELPPTPSSSAFSFLVNDSKESIEQCNHTTQLDTNSTRLPNTAYPCYGSVLSSSDYDDKQTTSSTPPSTISPNDDDEGLYLLWTHQLLRERGYQPSSCMVDDDNDDCCSMDSSVTGFSSAISQKQQKSRKLSAWLRSWFPIC